MPLSDLRIRQTKLDPEASRPIRLFDGQGLYIELTPSGSKLWRFKYRFDGREKRLALGVYPQVGLKEARSRRDEAKSLLAGGIDPSAVRQQKRREQAARTRL
ncbi:MAG: Arm DNA-binding domain-containing protein, partial [Desulfovibrionaceae bacterium]|nr:Arm DNA-binding domain-containing protein [Desulfovibrionaceae bacterium]